MLEMITVLRHAKDSKVNVHKGHCYQVFITFPLVLACLLIPGFYFESGDTTGL